MGRKKIEIGSKGLLKVETVKAVASGEMLLVSLPAEIRKMLSVRRAQIVSKISNNPEPAYGFNRGFGHNVSKAVSPERLAELQRNLVRSHSAGLGEPVAKEIIRATMLLQANSLALGYSAVRPEVVEALILMLNTDITPVVPSFGSLGASGDLAPLAHIALALIGEGLVFDSGSQKPEPAQKVFRRRKLKALTLEMKEGLALINGMQFSNAIAILSACKLRELLKVATISTALATQVFLGSDTAYSKELLSLRPHSGILTVGRWLRNLCANSSLIKVHAPYEVDGEVQDPYSLRCAPQILGACYDLIEEAIKTFEVEAGSVTDNPLLLEEPKNTGSFTRIVSGGHFHGMPVAVKIYNLMQAMGIMARLSNVRCARYVDEARNRGLGSDLIWPEMSEDEKATCSAMMVPEYLSAALTNQIWAEAMPSHLFSLVTDAGQEDHVSMSATLALRVYSTLPRLADALAVELAFASQAAAIRKKQKTIPSRHKPALSQEALRLKSALTETLQKELHNKKFKPVLEINLNYRTKPKDMRLNSECEAVLARIKKIVPPVTADRSLSQQLSALSEEVLSGRLLLTADSKLWS